MPRLLVSSLALVGIGVAILLCGEFLIKLSYGHFDEWTAPKSIDQMVDTVADRPIIFGFKNTWIAVRSHDVDSVARSIPVDNLQRANWKAGINAAYNGYLFVSPSVNGWVFIVCQNIPQLGWEPDVEEWRSLMELLSRHFGEAQYFGNHRVVGFAAWARYVKGAEARAYSYLGESGSTLIDRGARTPEEIELGYNYFNEKSLESRLPGYWEREDLTSPDEDHVMEVAGKWSINPMTLDSIATEVGVGWIGTLRHVQQHTKK